MSSTPEQTKSKSAQVFRGANLIGKITRTQSGSVFEYDSDFLNSLPPDLSEKGATYQLPYSKIRTETHGVNLHPYFAGLLPEGLRLKALVQKVKTSEDDLLSLLIASGADCIGDISVLPEDVPLSKDKHKSKAAVDVTKLSEVNFSDLFQQSISSGNFSDEINLPGIQNKLSASMISFPVHGKKDKHTYILKLGSPDFPRIIENESFFLAMARACGLIVNEAEIVKDATDTPGLLVKRFDREPVKRSQNILAIHQEDACQFLNRYPADKYLLSLSEIAGGIQKFCTAPILEIAKLIRLKAFSYLIANGDLHAKNISIHTVPNSDLIALTPAYDVLSTLPYGDQRMALKLDGRDDNIRRKDFVAFGNRHFVKEKVTLAILDEICDLAPGWISRLQEIGFPEKKTSQLKQVMQKRLLDLNSGF